MAPIAYSLLGGGVTIQEQRLYGTLDSVPLRFKNHYVCTCLISPPDGVIGVSPPPRSTPLHSAPLRSTPLHSSPLRSTPLRSAPLDPLAPRDASSPVPLAVPSVVWASASDSESVSVNAGSAASSAASAFSLAPFQYIHVYSHHRLGTRAPGRLTAFLHRSRIGRVAINCATVFCLRRIEVRILRIPVSFIAPTSNG